MSFLRVLTHTTSSLHKYDVNFLPPGLENWVSSNSLNIPRSPHKTKTNFCSNSGFWLLFYSICHGISSKVFTIVCFVSVSGTFTISSWGEGGGQSNNKGYLIKYDYEVWSNSIQRRHFPGLLFPLNLHTYTHTRLHAYSARTNHNQERCRTPASRYYFWTKWQCPDFLTLGKRIFQSSCNVFLSLSQWLPGA